MIWFGLTGGIACGKSTVSELLRKSSVPVIDADQIAKEVVLLNSEGLSEIISTFGRGILNTDSSLNRQKLGDIIFGDKEAKKKLESILHPRIRREVEQRKQILAKQGCKCAIYDIPLLYETNSQDNFDAVIVVTTTKDLQVQRMKGRGLNLTEIEKRLSSQWDLQKKVELADYVIENNGSYRELESKVTELVVWMESFNK